MIMTTTITAHLIVEVLAVVAELQGALALPMAMIVTTLTDPVMAEAAGAELQDDLLLYNIHLEYLGHHEELHHKDPPWHLIH
jgi:hypothetical protein